MLMILVNVTFRLYLVHRNPVGERGVLRVGAVSGLPLPSVRMSSSVSPAGCLMKIEWVGTHPTSTRRATGRRSDRRAAGLAQ